MMRRLLRLLSHYRWARRRLGGKWERWYIDHPVCAEIWHQVREWSSVTGTRPSGGCRGTPVREDWSGAP